MAYEKQTWECGETITAEKLNHIEDGIADASSGGGGTEPLIVRAQSFVNDGTTATLTFDKTWQQVHDAIENGVPCYFGVASNSMCNSSQVEDLSVAMYPIYETFTEQFDETAYELSSATEFEFYMKSPTVPLVAVSACNKN